MTSDFSRELSNRDTRIRAGHRARSRAALGVGAMGEVDRARDQKRGREVAIKVLPEHFSTDPERVLRLEREARTLAALNHPNVAPTFGVDQVGGTCFRVLELRFGISTTTYGLALTATRTAEELDAASAAYARLRRRAPDRLLFLELALSRVPRLPRQDRERPPLPPLRRGAVEVGEVRSPGEVGEADGTTVANGRARRRNERTSRPLTRRPLALRRPRGSPR
jgi:hypothetical protein